MLFDELVRIIVARFFWVGLVLLMSRHSQSQFLMSTSPSSCSDSLTFQQPTFDSREQWFHYWFRGPNLVTSSQSEELRNRDSSHAGSLHWWRRHPGITVPHRSRQSDAFPPAETAAVRGAACTGQRGAGGRGQVVQHSSREGKPTSDAASPQYCRRNSEACRAFIFPATKHDPFLGVRGCHSAPTTAPKRDRTLALYIGAAKM